jgi:1-acyl-sn-glycerol-3-phosphate acyltransferase
LLSLRSWRLVPLALHLAAGLVLAVVYRRLSKSARITTLRVWARGVLAILGVRVRIDGTPPTGSLLLVANHVSWLDIFALVAVCPGRFICKDEIAAWPVIGWLLARADTIFLRRGSARAAKRAVNAVTARLAAGEPVAVFPEGTSTTGDSVLSFKPALFQAAINAGGSVQPVGLSYFERDGTRSYVPVFAGTTTFIDSLMAIAATPGLEVRVGVLPALAAEGGVRRDLAERSHALIASWLGDRADARRVAHDAIEDDRFIDATAAARAAPRSS